MRTRNLMGALSVAGVLATIAAAPATSQPYYGDGAYGPGAMGPGMMGGGMMGGYGMGPGMMGGYGAGMMGRGMMGPGMMGGYGMGPGSMGWDYRQLNLNLSATDVKTYFERMLTLRGNPHIKVGSVAEMDVNTVSVDIVTTDKEGLVQRFNVDRHTGLFRPA